MTEERLHKFRNFCTMEYYESIKIILQRIFNDLA